jgi:uncharacterized alkaline shock family protein YloU
VCAIVERTRPRHPGVKITGADRRVAVELHLAVDWGVNVPTTGKAVQQRVAEYLGRMADLTPTTVDVVVDDIGAPPDGV